jgi:hypothetical protein
MKIPDTHISVAGVLNVFSLGAISLTWGHMLGLASLWLLPLTILLYLVGYASEVTKAK